MKIGAINNNNSQIQKSNQSFGSFIKLEMYSNFAGNAFYTRKNVSNEAVKTMTEVVEKIKKIVGDNLSFYRRKDNFNPLTKQVYDSEQAAKTLFIEDNNGKNREDLLKAANRLLELGGEYGRFEIFTGDLFAPKAKGLLNRSLLEFVAQRAKPEDMIKM